METPHCYVKGSKRTRGIKTKSHPSFFCLFFFKNSSENLVESPMTVFIPNRFPPFHISLHRWIFNQKSPSSISVPHTLKACQWTNMVPEKDLSPPPQLGLGSVNIFGMKSGFSKKVMFLSKLLHQSSARSACDLHYYLLNFLLDSVHFKNCLASS